MTTPASTPGDRREDHAQAVADQVTAAVAATELALIATVARLARKVATGAMSPAAAARKLRHDAQLILLASLPSIRAALARAGDATRTAAAKEAEAAIGGRVRPFPRGVDDWETRLSGSLSDALNTAKGSVQDAFRDAVTTGSKAPGSGARGNGHPVISLTRLQATQKALDELAASGVTGFTDAAGRNWNLTSYAEMATRTAVSNAWDGMQAQAMKQAGLDLIWTYTTSTEGSCPQCIPWLGRLLSLTGATPGFATLRQAKAAGFRHPNCRCSWIPESGGIAPRPANAATMARAARVYEASQQWRAAQRKSRTASRAASAAITPRARSAARMKLTAARH